MFFNCRFIFTVELGESGLQNVEFQVPPVDPPALSFMTH